jgi:hypothetical protein
MTRYMTTTLTALAVTVLTCASSINLSFAQEKQHISFKTSAANTKYIHQLNVDVGDVSNHVVRVFDLQRTHPNPPVINGVKLVEETARGTTDIIEGYGTSTGYGTYIMENGDKFNYRFTQVNQNDGGKITATGAGPITGGTGKFADLHGFVHFVVVFDVKSGFNEGQTDIEYWSGK